MAQLQHIKPRAPRTSVWKGPDIDGVTQSMLSRFLVCRERFRALVIDGVKPREKFDPKKDFGNMWHACEEALITGYAPGDGWETALRHCVENLRRKFQMDHEAINHWYSVTLALFPVYCEYWSKRGGITTGSVIREVVFDAPYSLPSGRVVRLRGKWDDVGLCTQKDHIWIGDHKTKSAIDVAKIKRQLKFDLQTMFYVIAGTADLKRYGCLPGPHSRGLQVKGKAITEIRYNVIRRSSHKTAESMLKKCHEDIFDRRGGEWFERFTATINQRDIETFQRVTLNPILEQLCDWWEMISTRNDPFSPSNNKNHYIHWRHPFGVYNVLDEGGATDLDEYITSGSMVGLQKVHNLFPELEQESCSASSKGAVVKPHRPSEVCASNATPTPRKPSKPVKPRGRS